MRRVTGGFSVGFETAFGEFHRAVSTDVVEEINWSESASFQEKGVADFDDVGSDESVTVGGESVSCPVLVRNLVEIFCAFFVHVPELLHGAIEFVLRLRVDAVVSVAVERAPSPALLAEIAKKMNAAIRFTRERKNFCNCIQ